MRKSSQVPSGKTKPAPPPADAGPKKKPGVRTIAEATGLSVATVSRVLNGAANVSAATREQVLAAMQDFAYAPNSAARALATQRTRTIAAVVPTLAHSIFARFLSGVEIELAKSDYGLIIATTDSDQAQELKRVRELLNLGAEGLILTGRTHSPELLKLVTRRDLPTVCISIYDPESELPTIGYDNEWLGCDAVDYLQSLGHRRIAVVHGPVGNNDRTERRIAGALKGAKAPTQVAFFENSLDVAGGAAAAREALKASPRPTAVLCLSDVIALGVTFEVERAGLKIPSDVSVMGFDDLDWAEFAAPPLTTIQLPTAHMGLVAAKALAARLDDGTAISDQLLDARIVVRASTAPPA